MSKTLKTLCASALLSVICGIILGLIRGNIMFQSPYPSFYLALTVSVVLLAIASYFIKSTFSCESNEDYSISTIPSNWEMKYKKSFQVMQIISAFLIIMASIRGLVFSNNSTLTIILSIFSFVCAVSIVLRVKSRESAENTALFSLFPVFYLCVYLLTFYRSTAKYPDLNLFGPQILTLASLVISAYLNSATKFGVKTYIFRFLFTLSSFALTIGDLIAYVIDSNTLSITEPAIYLPTIFGFILFYLVTLFIPPVKIFDLNSKAKKTKK